MFSFVARCTVASFLLCFGNVTVVKIICVIYCKLKDVLKCNANETAISFVWFKTRLSNTNEKSPAVCKGYSRGAAIVHLTLRVITAYAHVALSERDAGAAAAPPRRRPGSEPAPAQRLLHRLALYINVDVTDNIFILIAYFI